MTIKIDSKFYFLFLFLLVFTNFYAQKKIKVHKVSGISISRDKTPLKALEEAIKDAQINALRKAGVTEQVSVSTMLFNESNGETIKNYFNEISNIELQANIVTEKVYPEVRKFDENGNMVVSVDIDATIFKYNTKKDPLLFFKVNDLKDVYYENDLISFSFIPSLDGYLKIFVINKNETFLLYPFENKNQDYLSDSKNKLFRKNEKVFFPIHDAYKPGYSIELNNKEIAESSVLIFVFTKKNIPFIDDKVNVKTILNWIYNIPIDERKLLFKNLLLKHLN
ncbi:hypothetical protein MKD41_03490 [Lutibacter sp. A64]|uniref:hypothetical protein n=1 Tax=Lutibacter sp. A64 TaxID=2918526 RepID=UPI001F056745|nr:hypothetical protein [Lutibacter sp. A64]UMB54542.1 hypothetical protein MKD41_03490 [Lutibacter sp. A64]